MEHLFTFQSERPRSAQLADAVLWVMKASSPAPAEEGSDKPFWELITQHGDHWYVPAVDTLLTRFCTRREQPPGFSATLDQLLKSAETSGQTVLHIRILRAKARLEASRPEESARLLKKAIDLAQPQTTSPSLLADFADALLVQGEPERAIEHWRSLLKWHPRAAEKDRALVALANVAQANGDTEKALAWIARFESETENSPLLGAVLLKKASLFSYAGNDEEAKRNLECLLQKSGISGEWKSEALLGLAEHHMRKGTPRLAIPYYQRVYLMYGRWTRPLARAYLRSGMAFEQLQDWEAARRTYKEMLDRDIPNQPEEVYLAQERLQSLYDNGQ
jgi:tetratricopeptide (TPR) repeat protein